MRNFYKVHGSVRLCVEIIGVWNFKKKKYGKLTGGGGGGITFPF